MNIIKQLIISIALFFVNLIPCMDKPSSGTQASLTPLEMMYACETQLEVNSDAMQAYRAALASPAVDGLTQMQKAKQYLKTQIVQKKQEIAQVKVAVNFDVLSNHQMPRGDKYDYLLDCQNKLEAELPLRTELMSLKLAYCFTKQELIRQTSDRIDDEIKPYFPPCVFNFLS
jgi:hypothetical protein